MRSPTGREPTVREMKMIAYLLKRAGSEPELHRWIKLAGPRRQRGRPPNSSPFTENDDEALHICGIAASRDRYVPAQSHKTNRFLGSLWLEKWSR